MGARRMTRARGATVRDFGRTWALPPGGILRAARFDVDGRGFHPRRRVYADLGRVHGAPLASPPLPRPSCSLGDLPMTTRPASLSRPSWYVAALAAGVVAARVEATIARGVAALDRGILCYSCGYEDPDKGPADRDHAPPCPECGSEATGIRWMLDADGAGTVARIREERATAWAQRRGRLDAEAAARAEVRDVDDAAGSPVVDVDTGAEVPPPSALATLRAVHATACHRGPLRDVDPDLCSEAGMDGNYRTLLQAARDLDEGRA